MTPSRRQFLQLAGGSAAALALTGHSDRTAIAAEQPGEKTSAKQTNDFALASYSVKRFPLDKALAIANRLRLKHICLKDSHLPLTSTPEQIAQAAAKVKAAGIDLYACGVVSMHKAADVQRAFEYAKAAGMRMIIAMPSFDVLPLLNEKVKEFDIQVAIHNHGPGDKFFPLPGDAYKRIKDFDRRVGLCIDIGHTVRAGADPSQAAEQFADRLLDVHIKDVSSATAKGHTVEAGRGVIDLPRFLRTIKKIGYTGYLSFEFEKDGDDPLPGLAEAVGYVHGVLAAI